jgi:general secretion pathway protein I
VRFFSPRRPSAGFSLVEVIVALAILGLAVGAIATVFGSSAVGHTTARNVDLALALAEEKINAIGISEPLKLGRSEGTFDERLAWQITVANYEDRRRRLEPVDLSSTKLFRVDITVSWHEGVRERQVALTTVRGQWAPP